MQDFKASFEKCNYFKMCFPLLLFSLRRCIQLILNYVLDKTEVLHVHIRTQVVYVCKKL